MTSFLRAKGAASARLAFIRVMRASRRNVSFSHIENKHAHLWTIS